MGYLVTLHDVCIGPPSLKRVRGSVSEYSTGDEVLLGMSFLRLSELAHRGRTIALRVPACRPMNTNARTDVGQGSGATGGTAASDGS